MVLFSMILSLKIGKSNLWAIELESDGIRHSIPWKKQRFFFHSFVRNRWTCIIKLSWSVACLVIQQKMLPSRILFILNFYDLFGYNSGVGWTKCHLVANIIYVQHIIFAMLFTLYKIRLTLGLLHAMQWIEFFNQMLKYSAALNAYWLIVLDSIFYRRQHQRFWNILQTISIEFAHQNDFKIGLYILKVISYFSMVVTSVSIVSITTDLTAGLGETVFLHFIFLIKMCQLRVFYYIFCIDTLHFQFKMIERELKLVNRWNLKHPAYTFRWIRRYYYCIYEMSTLLNQVFGWNQVVVVSFCFYFFLTDLNWVYTHYLQLTFSQLLSKFGK